MLVRQDHSSLVLQAPAKLNLFLRIAAKRKDGYHDIETVMVAISLFDTLTIRALPDDELSFRCLSADRLSHESIPTDASNLVVRAAQLLRLRTGCRLGASLELVKRIPSAAGLGGGSSDAAAALAGLNRLWDLRLSRAELITLAAEIGSDIGFFLGPTGSAFCHGRGELIEPLSLPAALHFVVARPESGLSTPLVYQHCRVDAENRSVSPLLSAMKMGAIGRLARGLHNGLQEPAEHLNADVTRLRNLFDRLNLPAHQMSGSGTAYFGVCTTRQQAQQAAAQLRAWQAGRIFVTRMCG